MTDSAAPTSTLADVAPPAPRRRARAGRRLVLVLLALVIALGATTMLGVQTGTVRASANGYDLRVDYPRIARSGLDITWRVTIRHPGGFGTKPLTVAVSARYFDIFEHQAFYPSPSAETGDGTMLYLDFDPPPGEVFSLDFDAYVQTSSQLGRRGEVALMDGQRSLVRADFRTWLIP
ncbi:MAG: hypothetical protein ACT4P1_09825 [Sporichthyaceae bacterium]